jgi:hypothetical protein
MIETTKLNEEIAKLDELIEAQVKIISSKLEVTQKISALEDDAAELTRLIRLRKFKGGLLNNNGKSASPGGYKF